MESCIAFVKCDLCAHPLGDIGADHKNARRFAARGFDRLVDEVDEPFLDRPSGPGASLVSGAARTVGVAAGKDAVEQCQVTLRDKLRESLGNRPSDDRSVADQPQVGRIGDGDGVSRSFEHREEAGRLLKQLGKAVPFPGAELRHAKSWPTAAASQDGPATPNAPPTARP